jgi:hypothetical protein
MNSELRICRLDAYIIAYIYTHIFQKYFGTLKKDFWMFKINGPRRQIDALIVGGVL